MAKRLNSKGDWQEVPNRSKDNKNPNKSPSNQKGSSTAQSQTNVGDTRTNEQNARNYSNQQYTLKGDANVFPDPSLKAKQNIQLEGLGSYLSGAYYIEQVKHTWGSSGYTQSVTLVKNGFIGNSMKPPTSDRNEKIEIKKEGK